MAFKVYDADEVSVSIAGIAIDPGAGDGGYADGEFLSIEHESDRFLSVVGTDGDVTRSKSNDRRATLTLSLMQTSASNAKLSALFNLDDNTPNGAGVGALMVRDKSGTSIYEAAECWIKAIPPVSFAREATPREWQLECARLNYFQGGN